MEELYKFLNVIFYILKAIYFITVIQGKIFYFYLLNHRKLNKFSYRGGGLSIKYVSSPIKSLISDIIFNQTKSLDCGSGLFLYDTSNL